MQKREGAAPAWLLAITLLVVVVGTALAANNSAPSGWGLFNRERARHAMGVPIVYKAICSATNTLPATGVAVGDIVAGMINLSDASETQESLDDITVAANSITSSGTPWTAGEHYFVVVWRKQSGR